MPPRPYKYKSRLFVNGTIHFVDRYVGFGGEWVMFCGERIHLDADGFTKYGSSNEVNCMSCIVEEGGVHVAS